MSLTVLLQECARMAPDFTLRTIPLDRGTRLIEARGTMGGRVFLRKATCVPEDVERTKASVLREIATTMEGHSR